MSKKKTNAKLMQQKDKIIDYDIPEDKIDLYQDAVNKWSAKYIDLVENNGRGFLFNKEVRIFSWLKRVFVQLRKNKPDNMYITCPAHFGKSRFVNWGIERAIKKGWTYDLQKIDKQGKAYVVSLPYKRENILYIPAPSSNTTLKSYNQNLLEELGVIVKGQNIRSQTTHNLESQLAS